MPDTDATPPDFDRALRAIAASMRGCGSQVRINILAHLVSAPMDVGQLAALCGRDIATTSRHVSHLQRTGLVARRKDRTRCIQSLAPAVRVTQGEDTCELRLDRAVEGTLVVVLPMWVVREAKARLHAHLEPGTSPIALSIPGREVRRPSSAL